ncbi:uracil-DNA glycosylase [Helicobacter winghamensis]|uniref:Uracil-DNA glycosylase n=1 Tax=Helicobacter winghamensis TaxID=157268 RepID=A0A2N3PJH1_9HELI|nr:uracil-DNA glycosylase [Helicobacter winghamensis]EEO25345.1 uracil-DNA glycosylase [Helicobacter winghamensis ATCC BAA-430]PKT78213.1 uracil-DNA glycosylase [Helicobacter winghamensis]PKT78482.1 uracil-DNA glycosylase [Helicobacter winghamensis]PKT78742.1 uracil-DNA glycosylase [Helicobacter winghamensis]PKT80513.1 uracil-DNA glycosylase [Helicobacter winghamensis]
MIKLDSIKIEESWKKALEKEFLSPYFLEIKKHYVEAKSKGAVIYPPANLTFNAFNSTPFEKVKVVLLGQDPYHNPNEAMGLSFSVPQGVRIPPSLRNIYRELEADLGIPQSKSGDLSAWAREGVLLLNSILSVEAHKPASHQHFGWQQFTDSVIATLSKQKDGIVFLLWGNYAKSKKTLIDTKRHCVLEAAHPSPLARSGFMGCKHFSKTNTYLQSIGKTPINWNLDF